MSQLSISYQHPKYVSDIFAGSVIIDCTFPTEGFHLVTVESSKDQENWSVFQSQVVDLNLSFKVLSPSKSLFFRLTMSKQPTAINIDTIIDDTTTKEDIENVIEEKCADVALSGQAKDVTLTAITGLVATQVQAAIAELLAKIISLGAAISYEGQVADYAHLPSSDLKKGHMYNVVAANDNIPAGTIYVWNGESWDRQLITRDGESWDPMVGQIDLTPFLTSTDAASTYVALNASATNAGSDIVRLLGVNSQGKAISITPKAIVEYVIKTLMDDDLLAV